ncbi:E3 ubiquitin-protein ligase rififylin [Acipenser ruthenus]|uniref:E3 ubiquitin-protein ligase rififylin n=1 Tax=Acipenser ruthenus TaxID=7906 RepID=A0A444UTA6_ACIRT|nr:E3 ubiquitin-protein ligase rififylin [Acipenser ruthenus]
MWASCCNWLCLDVQPVEEERGRSQRQAYTNSGFRASPPRPAPEHTCKACGSHFSTSSRKHVCMDCKKSFCGSCSVQPALSPRMCLSCQRCCGTAFLRTELMKLKVKELRDYLHLHEVSTELCREKEDLVELVLGQHTPPASQGPNPPATGATQATSQGGPSPHTEPAAEPLAEEGQQVGCPLSSPTVFMKCYLVHSYTQGRDAVCHTNRFLYCNSLSCDPSILMRGCVVVSVIMSAVFQ